MTPFEALYEYKPNLVSVIGEPTSVAAVDTYLQHRQNILQTLKTKLAKAQNSTKQLADRKRSEREFEVGEEVYLKLSQPQLKSILKQPMTKLSPKFYGLYSITTKIGPVAYRLQLPEETQVHLVFHVSLLRKATGSQTTS